jgi:hypothetical protein
MCYWGGPIAGKHRTQSHKPSDPTHKFRKLKLAPPFIIIKKFNLRPIEMVSMFLSDDDCIVKQCAELPGNFGGIVFDLSTWQDFSIRCSS